MSAGEGGVYDQMLTTLASTWDFRGRDSRPLIRVVSFCLEITFLSLRIRLESLLLVSYFRGYYLDELEYCAEIVY